MEHSDFSSQNEEKKISEIEEKPKLLKFTLTEEMKEELEKKILNDSSSKTEFWYKKYEEDSKRNWDIFYRHNTTNFFHDRNYIDVEFPELNTLENSIFCELGCGVGNTIFPLLKKFDNMNFYGFDISKNAINLLKKSEKYDEKRIKVEVCDLVKDDLPKEFPAPDFCSLVFVLSAISPENHDFVIKKISEFLKKDSVLYFRDYARLDLAQIRLAERKVAKLKDNFYIKTDRTRVFYFEKEALEELFVKNGFKVISNDYCYRVIENRKTEQKMHRIWLQARFIKE